jgi:hypothetical protein
VFQANAFQVNAFQIGDVAGIAPPFVPPASDQGGPQGGLKKRRRRPRRDYDDPSYDLGEGFSGRPVPLVDDEADPSEFADVVPVAEPAPDTAMADALRTAIANAKAEGKRQKAEAMELAKRLQLEEEELEELLLLIAAM